MKKRFIWGVLFVFLLTPDLNAQFFCGDPPQNSLNIAFGDGYRVGQVVGCGCADLRRHECMAKIFMKAAPDSWTSKIIFFDILHQIYPNPYYYDNKFADYFLPNLAPKDADPERGIDTSMLFFHAGHGQPTDFHVGNKTATTVDFADIKCMRLGNCQGFMPGLGNNLRYFWQCACNVFAHGPPSKPPDEVQDNPDYVTPGDFRYGGCPGDPIKDDPCKGYTEGQISPCDKSGVQDCCRMRDVRVRWGSALGKSLRMACGLSSRGICNGCTAERLWEYYSDRHYSVADAFIAGMIPPDLAAADNLKLTVVPLCIALGGRNPMQSPLYIDERFTNEANPFDPDDYHIQYALIVNKKILRLPRFPEVPLSAPIFTMAPPSPPVPESPSWSVNSISGGIYYRGKQKEMSAPKDAESYINSAKKFVKKFGLHEAEIDEKSESSEGPLVIKMMIDSKSKSVQKNVIVKFKRHIKFKDKSVPVLGTGGEISVQMNNDGTVINASKIWRQITGIKDVVPVKSYKKALSEVLDTTKEAEKYKVQHWSWGYKEYSGKYKQDEMRIYYTFYLKKSGKDNPPEQVEVLAQTD